MLALHAVAGLDPVHSVISEYAYRAGGWLLPASLTLFAAGAAMIAMALARDGVDRRVAALVLAWGAAIFLVGAFPTDPPGVPLSYSGGVHRYAAFVAFLVMPVAGLLLAGSRLRYARAIRALSAVAFGALALTVLPYLIGPLGGGFPAGAIQRTVVMAELGVLALAGLSPLRPSARPARPARPPAARGVALARSRPAQSRS